MTDSRESGGLITDARSGNPCCATALKRTATQVISPINIASDSGTPAAAKAIERITIASHLAVMAERPSFRSARSTTAIATGFTSYSRPAGCDSAPHFT